MERKIFAHLQRAQELLQNNYAFGAGTDVIDLTSEDTGIDLIDESPSQSQRPQEEEARKRPRRSRTNYASSSVADIINHHLTIAENMNR